MDKITLRQQMNSLRESETDKQSNYLVWFKMRDGYYRGISVADKKIISQNFSGLSKTDYRIEDKTVSIGVERI
jgi:hypothetical protein